MVKPVILKELLLRVKALLRRYKINCESEIILPNTQLYYRSNCVVCLGKKTELTKKEFLL